MKQNWTGCYCEIVTGLAKKNLITVIVCLLTLAVISPITPAMADKNQVKVMTRNLYLGADIFQVVGASESTNPMAVPLAVTNVFKTMQQTNFVERAEAIADEIMQYSPHCIGLQEVSTILMQSPGDFVLGNMAPNAETVVYDYLTILLSALESRGLNYQVAVTVTNADVELPMIAGVTPEGMPVFNDVRLVDHDVILVRSDIAASNPLAANFAYNAEMSLPNGPTLKFTRGYVAVDINVKGEDYRFVNTHLEVGGEPGSGYAMLQAAQMQELVAVLSNETKPVILVGDLNSSPYAPVGQAYSQAVAAGYVDTWELRKNQSEGFTCCFNETVNNPETDLYERIDHIFMLPKEKEILKVRTKVLGDEPIDQTANGLWPSDHAGVIAKIAFLEE